MFLHLIVIPCDSRMHLLALPPFSFERLALDDVRDSKGVGPSVWPFSSREISQEYSPCKLHLRGDKGSLRLCMIAARARGGTYSLLVAATGCATGALAAYDRRATRRRHVAAPTLLRRQATSPPTFAGDARASDPATPSVRRCAARSRCRTRTARAVPRGQAGGARDCHAAATSAAARGSSASAVSVATRIAPCATAEAGTRSSAARSGSYAPSSTRYRATFAPYRV